MAKYNLSSVDSYSYEPLRKQVYDVLREAILRGNIEPGEKITEVEIADQLSVSRTPVREAFRMLELEELIIIIPQQGVFVAGVKSQQEIDEIFLVRRELEGLAAYEAAKNITREQAEKLKLYSEQIKECIEEDDLKRCVRLDISFHQIIKEASHNKYLEKFLDSLFEKVTRFRSKSLGQQGRMEKALNEHKQLASAIADGDSELARKLSQKHIDRAWNSIVSVFIDEHEQESG